ncbi:secreted RxLR effector protein 161-like [Arachis hypogaea]|uniref:secreted RxLR effector protein 161-like n=1 Tax=Arachis hypogaea TaxID=3818 RepID=UPI003B2273B9
MNYSTQLSKSTGTPLEDVKPYRRLIGRLIYLTNTRPDICYAVSKLSQFLDCATDEHFKAALHILRYLKHAPSKGLLFDCSCDLSLRGFINSDLGTCPDTRRSVFGYYFFLGNSLVSWKSKKQQTVARSSSEAEYRTMTLATCEGIWLIYILNSFRITLVKPMTLFCDSQSARHIASNPVFHERTKHIEIDCHKVKQKVHDAMEA